MVVGQPYWTFKAPLPQPRLAPAMVVLGGNPLLTGGSYEVSLADLLLLLFCRRENYSSDSMSFQKGRGSDTCQDFCHQIHQCTAVCRLIISVVWLKLLQLQYQNSKFASLTSIKFICLKTVHCNQNMMMVMVMMTVMTTTMMMIKKTTVMMMVVTNPHLFLHAQHQNKPLSAQKSGFPRRGGGERSSSLTTFSSTRSMISIIVPVPLYQYQCSRSIMINLLQYQVYVLQLLFHFDDNYWEGFTLVSLTKC